MTALERAIAAIDGAEVRLGGGTYSELSYVGACGLLDDIESAGLRIVDAELFAALVEAVRAAMWCDARSWAARYPWRQQVHNNFHESELANERNVATLAHRRAVELLERGEA